MGAKGSEGCGGTDLLGSAPSGAAPYGTPLVGTAPFGNPPLGNMPLGGVPPGTAPLGNPPGGIAPGAIVPDVARRLNISPQHLFAWRGSARAGALGLPADTAPLFVHSSRW